MAKFECKGCGYIFDEQQAGIKFSEIMECPICAGPREEFEQKEEEKKETKDEKKDDAGYVIEKRQEFWLEEKDKKPEKEPDRSNIETYYDGEGVIPVKTPEQLEKEAKEKEEAERPKLDPIEVTGTNIVERGDRSSDGSDSEVVVVDEATSDVDTGDDEKKEETEAGEEKTEEKSEETEAGEEKAEEKSEETEAGEEVSEKTEDNAEDDFFFEEVESSEPLETEEIPAAVSAGIHEEGDFFTGFNNSPTFGDAVRTEEFIFDDEEPVGEAVELDDEVEEAAEAVEATVEETTEETAEEVTEETTEAAEEKAEEAAETETSEEEKAEEATEEAAEEAVEETTEAAEEKAEEAAETEASEEEKTEESIVETAEEVAEETAEAAEEKAEEAAETEVSEEEKAEETTEEIAEETEEVIAEAEEAEEAGEEVLSDSKDFILVDDEEEEKAGTEIAEDKKYHLLTDEQVKSLFEQYGIGPASNGLEGIILLPAQLDPMPLGRDEEIDTESVIGKFSAQPVFMNQPFACSESFLWGEYIPGEDDEADYSEASLILVKGKNSHIPTVSGKKQLRKEVALAKEKSGGKPIGLSLMIGRIEQDLAVCVNADVDFVVLNDVSSGMLPYALRRAINYLSRVNSGIDVIVSIEDVNNAQEIAKLLALGADYILLKREYSETTTRRLTAELREIARNTGHKDVHGLNMYDICTIDRDLAANTDILHF